MKNLSLIVLTSLLTLLISFMFLKPAELMAQGKTFHHVDVISGGGGFIRFFDKTNGKLYTYNKDLSEVIRVVKLTELGLPGVKE